MSTELIKMISLSYNILLKNRDVDRDIVITDGDFIISL